MWGDDEPHGEVPSPRTTIVGGRPPEEGAELPPVPTGIQQLLRLAAVDPAFRRELLERRGEVADAAGLTLTQSERLVLRAVPPAQLSAMIDGLPPPAEDRRTFLRETASSAVLLLGGAALAATEMSCIRGAKADVPPEPNSPTRPERPEVQTTGGAAPDPPPPRPQHRETENEGGISPHLREPASRPVHNETSGLGGVRAPVPEERETRRMPAPGGAAPDVPKPRPDAGPPRPKRPSPTRGIEPSVPPERGSAEDLVDPFDRLAPAPEHNPMQAKGGAAPDVPPPRPDAGPPRPKRPSPTRGIRPRVPPSRGLGVPGDDED
jgi:hypothetical protein